MSCDLVCFGRSGQHVAEPHKQSLASNCGWGNFPPGRGILWAIIHRRQIFCERIQSPPFQNCSTLKRRAYFFVRMQLEMRQLLARAEMYAAVCVAR